MSSDEQIANLAAQVVELRAQMAELRRVGAPKIDTAATASTVLRRDTAGSIPAARSSGAALFALDASATGSVLTIANAATATPFGNSANFSGVFIVNDTTVDGALAVFATGGNIMTKVAETVANIYTITAATASRINVYLVGQVVTIQNNTGVTRNLNVMALRSRAAN